MEKAILIGLYWDRPDIMTYLKTAEENAKKKTDEEVRKQAREKAEKEVNNSSSDDVMSQHYYSILVSKKAPLSLKSWKTKWKKPIKN